MNFKKSIYLTIVCTFYICFGFTQNDTLSNPSGCHMDFEIADNSCNFNNIFFIEVVNYPNDTLGVSQELKEVKLMIQHSWDSELDIYLISPNGVSIELSTQNGSFGNNYGEITDLLCGNPTVFTSNPCSGLSIINGTAPFIGEYEPEGDFIDFNGSQINGLWQLKICDNFIEDVGSLEYIELVFGDATCIKPVISNIVNGTNDVIVTSISEQINQSVIIEYGPIGFIPGTELLPNQGDVIIEPYTSLVHSTVLSNLNANTTYDVYVRLQCDNSGSFSRNSCLSTFTTYCNVGNETHVENFDSFDLCTPSCGSDCNIDGMWSNDDSSDFDWTVSSGPTASSFTGPYDDVTGGGNYLYIETSGLACRNGNEAILSSNCVNILGGQDSCHMSFQYNMYGTNIGGLKLEVSLDMGQSWNLLWNQFGNQGDDWHNQFIDLSIYINSNVQFRFIGIGGPGHRGDIAIDDIKFYGSIDLEATSFEYYIDLDQDGFGNINSFIQTCSPSAPLGYTNNSNDCNDNDNTIHPDALDIPCNNIDENCDLVENNTPFAFPTTINDSICNTDIVNLIATPVDPNNLLFWYNVSSGGNPIFVGTDLQYNGLNNSDTIQTQTFFIEEQNNCTNNNRTPLVVTVFPNNLFTNIDSLSFCIGDNINIEQSSLFNLDLLEQYTLYSDAGYTNLMGSFDSSIGSNTTVYIEAFTSFGCVMRKEIFVSIHSSPSVEILNQDSLVLCYNDVQLLLAQANGQGPLSFNWNTGSTGTILAINGNGQDEFINYNVIVTDQSGCHDIDSISIFNPPTINNFSVDSIIELTSFNSEDGKIGISYVGGVSPFTISWFGTESGQETTSNMFFVLDFLSQGFYNISVEDSNGCPVQFPEIYVPSSGIFPKVDSVRHSSCYNSEDGAIFLDITGGVEPYDVIWSNDSTQIDLENIIGGLYSVTITDAINEIIVFNDIEINNPAPLNYTSQLQDILCFGDGNGFISVNPFGGTPPYAHSWNNNSTNNVQFNMGPGLYIDTITDNNGCILISNELIIQESNDLFFDYQIDSITCQDLVDGGIYLNVTGGTPPYYYQWSNNRFTPDVLNLAEGTYSCTITDANGCFVETNDIEMNPQTPMSININVHNLTCFDNIDGEISIHIENGQGPYSIYFQDTLASDLHSNLDTGTYKIKVIDLNSCTEYNNEITLFRDDFLFFDGVVNLPLCSGANDGSIDLSIFNAIGPVEIRLNNQIVSEPIVGLSDSIYYVEVQDSFGCVYGKSFNIISNQNITLEVDTINPISCYNENNGFILLSSSSTNNDGLSYYWNNNQNSLDQFNLESGSYLLNIVSDAGCTYDTLFELTNPLPLSLTDTIVDNASCVALEDGSIEVIVTGGVGPYNYFWNNGQISDVLSSVGVGFYSASIFDDNDCSISTGLIQITEPEPIIINNNTPQHSGCNEFSGHYSNISIEGGVSPYSFMWSNDSTSQNLTNVQEGNYSVTVFDATNNCSESYTNIVIESDYYALTQDTILGISPSCDGVDEGIAIINLIGGQPPYQYNWSYGQVNTTLFSTDTLHELPMGSYNVTVTDDNGCTFISDTLDLFLVEEMTIDVVNIQYLGCQGATNGFIEVSVNNAIPPITYHWSKVGFGQLNMNSPLVTNLENGLYYLEVEDGIGCMSEQYSFIMAAQPVSVYAEIDTVQLSCNGEEDAQLSVNVFNFINNYQTVWNSTILGDTIKDLSAGVYTLEISDDAGCMYFDTITLTEPPAINIDSFDLVHTHCLTSNSGMINLQTSGGIGALSIDWNNNTNEFEMDSLYAGDYFAIISDINNCALHTDTFSINANWLDIDIDLIELNNVSCYNLMDGSILLDIPSTELFNYHFDWSNEDTTLSIENLLPGNYSMTLTDNFGCDTISPQFQISEPEPLTVDFQITSETVPNMDGTITSIGDGGTLPYSFYWDLNTGSQEGSFIFGLNVGCYIVTMVDNQNCALQDTACVQDIVSNIDLYNDDNIVIYPNPNHGRFTISNVSHDLTFEQIKLVDILGKEIYTSSLNDEHIIELNLEFISSGIYNILLYTSKGLAVKKIIIE